jgi:hypothetical protein
MSVAGRPSVSSLQLSPPSVDFQTPDLAPPLVGGGIEGVRIAGIDLEIGGAGVGPEVEDASPGGAAVLGLEDAALASARPERPLGGDPDDGRVIGMH